MFFNHHTIALGVLFQKSAARSETFLLVFCLIYMLQHIVRKLQGVAYVNYCLRHNSLPFRLWRVLKCTLRDVIQLFTPEYKSSRQVGRRPRLLIVTYVVNLTDICFVNILQSLTVQKQFSMP